MKGITMVKQNKGYTIMELVVVMFAMSVITAAIAPFIKVNVDSYLNVTETKFGIQTARISFNKMLSELRLYANNDNIDRAYSDRIRFTRGSSGEVIDYRYYVEDGEGGIFIADETGSLLSPPDYDPLIGGVESFSIDYYDNAGGSAGSISNIWRIEIHMEVKNPYNEDQIMFFVGQICLNRF